MEHSKKVNQFIWEKSVKGAGALASMGFLLFTLAGKTNILGFWLYTVVAILYQVISLLIIVPRYPVYIALTEAHRREKMGHGAPVGVDGIHVLDVWPGSVGSGTSPRW